MDPVLTEKLRSLTQILKQTVRGSCAIALAGAHAKGMADPDSDIDIYLFAEEERPFAQRQQIIASAADPGTNFWVSPSFDDAPWGGSMDFSYQGTPVEVVGRTLSRMDQVLDECLEGTFSILPATWTSNGYYTYIYLSELSFLKLLWDPQGILARYQAKAAVYPEALRRRILEVFLERAGTWMGNFHYESAVKRGDRLFSAPIVLHTLLDMIQVVFALDRVYFPGDKKLEQALRQLPGCPKLLLEELPTLLSGDPGDFPRQKEILYQLWQELHQRGQAVLDTKP